MPGVLRFETLNVKDPAMVRRLIEVLTELAASGRYPLGVRGNPPSSKKILGDPHEQQAKRLAHFRICRFRRSRPRTSLRTLSKEEAPNEERGQSAGKDELQLAYHPSN